MECSPDTEMVTDKQNKRKYGTKRATVGERIMIASNLKYFRR